MARPRTHDEALRLKLLDRAGELIAADGPKALSLRKLAADAGTSTTAVYSLFGSKPDLVNALYTEGFRRFGARMAGTALTGDPVEDLVALGSAYRAMYYAPDSPTPRNTVGTILVRVGQFRPAREAFERALALARQEPERRFLERRLAELATRH